MNSYEKLLAFLFVSLIPSFSFAEMPKGVDIKNPTVEGEILVQFDRGLSQRQAAKALQPFNEQGINLTQYSAKQSLGRVTIPTNEWINFNDYLDLLEKSKGVEGTEQNYKMYTTTLPESLNDPGMSYQWHINDIGTPLAWQSIGGSNQSEIIVAVVDTGVMINHEDLRANIWKNNGELPNNGIDDDDNGLIDDVNGWDFGDNDNDPNEDVCGSTATLHGSHVAGLIGAVGNNQKGVVGVAPKIKIMPLKVASKKRNCGLDSTSILMAVIYAVENGAKVINLSLGGPIPSSLAYKVFDAASNAGALLVIAASNDGLNNDSEVFFQPDKNENYRVDASIYLYMRNNKVLLHTVSPAYPASYRIPGIMSVAASAAPKFRRETGDLAIWRFGDKTTPQSTPEEAYDNFSRTNPTSVISYTHHAVGAYIYPNRKKNWIDYRDVKKTGTPVNMGSNYGRNSVHIAAPGQDILSTAAKSDSSSNNRLLSSYHITGGTSMAAPIVAGSAALLWSSMPELTNLDVKKRLMTSVDKSNRLRSKTISGGKLNILNALCGENFSKKAEGCSKTASKSGLSTKTRSKRKSIRKRQEESRRKPSRRRNDEDTLKGWLTDEQEPTRGGSDESGSMSIEW